MKNMKKLLSAIGLLTVVVPTTLSVVACGPSSNDNVKDSEQKIVDAIKKIEYKWENAKTKNKVADLIKKINDTTFIQDQLNEDIKESFNQSLFHLNEITKEDGTKVSDSDFNEAQTLQTKINFNYDIIENQETSLIITIIEGRISLSEVFNGFQFKDSRDVKNFVDNNIQANIKDQIQGFLGLEDLEKENLILSNNESNSIVLKAEQNSHSYQGEVILTWNLKLFEIWGVESGFVEPILKAGLKGYFYLDISKKIRFFNVVSYKSTADIPIQPKFEEYHSFEFLNSNDEQLKKFIFNGTHWVKQIENLFNVVNFEPDMKIKVTSPELFKARIFQSNEWVGLKKDSEFIINSIGELIIKE